MAYSYTQISLFEKCPFAYKCRYIDKIKKPKSKALTNGIAKHDACENYLKGKINKIEGVHQNSVLYLNKLKDHQAGSEEFWHFDKKWKPKDDWSHIVVKIDAYYIPKDGTLVVSDFKTGKVYPSHNHQLHMYATAGLAEYDCKLVLAEAHYLDRGTTVIKQYESKNFKSMVNLWNGRIKSLAESKEYNCKPGYHCGWCEYNYPLGGPCKHG